MTANSELIFSQISEIGIRLYRELCMNSPGSGEYPALLTELCRTTAECEYAELWKYDRSRNELRRLFPAEVIVSARTGLMGRAVADRQPVTGFSDEPRCPAVSVMRSVLAMPVMNEDGDLVGVLRLVNKLSADSFTEWDIRRLTPAAIFAGTTVVRENTSGKAFIDKHTGLRNRRGLLADLAPDGRYGSRFSDNEFALSMFICDIDKFKSINDYYGITAGDALLRSVADTLAESCRPEDTVYRLGGEEYIVLLPDTKLKECAAVAESLRVKVQGQTFVVGDEVIRLTLSFGCCRFDPALSAEGNISAADGKLFTAKESGRNRVAY